MRAWGTLSHRSARSLRYRTVMLPLLMGSLALESVTDALLSELLEAGVPAEKAGGSCPRKLLDAHGLHQFQERVDLVRRSNDLHSHVVPVHMRDFRLVGLAVRHELLLLLRAFRVNLDERELPDDRDVRRQVADLDDVDHLVELLRQLLVHLVVPLEGDGHPR